MKFLIVTTNDLLNFFSGVPSTVDLSLTAVPIGAEAIKTIKALSNDGHSTNALLSAFLTNVIRIDTTVSSGYGNALNTRGSLITRRKLADGVIDITLNRYFNALTYAELIIIHWRNIV